VESKRKDWPGIVFGVGATMIIALLGFAERDRARRDAEYKADREEATIRRERTAEALAAVNQSLAGLTARLDADDRLSRVLEKLDRTLNAMEQRP